MEQFPPEEKKQGLSDVRVKLTIWSVIALLILLAPLLAVMGEYGWVLFITAPFSIGMLVALLRSLDKKQGFGKLFLISLIPVGIISIVFAVLASEGLICILMAIPVVLVPLVLGTLTGYLIQNHYWSKYVAFAFIFLLNTSAYTVDRFQTNFDTKTIRTEMVINAGPEIVWKQLVNRFEFGSADNFFLSHGVSYPQWMELRTEGNCQSLFCQYTNGEVKATIDSLVPDQLMRFSVHDAPVTMKETSLYSEVEPKHVRGRVLINYGEFRLEPINFSQTKVIATTQFRNSIGPRFYWNLWGGYLMDKMHAHVLEKIKTSAETEWSTKH